MDFVGSVPNNVCDAKRRRLDQMLKDIGVVKKAKIKKKVCIKINIYYKHVFKQYLII